MVESENSIFLEMDSTEILKVRNLEEESLGGNLEASFKGHQGSTSGCRAIKGGEGERRIKTKIKIPPKLW
jgi:hypothetical protein